MGVLIVGYLVFGVNCLEVLFVIGENDMAVVFWDNLIKLLNIRIIEMVGVLKILILWICIYELVIGRVGMYVVVLVDIEVFYVDIVYCC